jgi:2-iminoacetate synthase ThiH
MAYKISLRATIVGGLAERIAESVAAVAEHLDEIQQNTPAFLGFTLSSDRVAGTALFSMYVDEDDPEDATAAAHAWAVTAINATGDSTRQWATFAHPERHERVAA